MACRGKKTQRIGVRDDREYNPYLPELATVTRYRRDANIKSSQVVFNDAEKMKNFTFAPARSAALGFGCGRSTFVINPRPPTRMEYLQFSVMKAVRLLRRFTESMKLSDRREARWALVPYND
jgi:hypothetical protein